LVAVVPALDLELVIAEVMELIQLLHPLLMQLVAVVELVQDKMHLMAAVRAAVP
jgi:hypothetical protein